MLKTTTFLLCCWLGLASAWSQIITVDPPLPTADDTVTITYDATQGSAGLVGVSPVYMHTGVITENSTGPSDWQYVVANWGTTDAKVEMTPLGNNLHQIRFHIRSYYGVPANEKVERMAFVFRNGAGTQEGKTATGGDIFYDVVEPGLQVSFQTPSESGLLVNGGQQLPLAVVASEAADLIIYDNGVQVAQGMSVDSLAYTLTAATAGDHTILVVGTTANETARDSFVYAVRENIPRAFVPAGTELGATYLNDSTVRLFLRAPQKSSVYVQGSFNQYQYRAAYQMTPQPDNSGYWIDLTLTPGETYTYQYVVDETIRIADPYSELILNQNDDRFIPSITYPNLPPYPTATSGNVTVLQPGKQPYNWQHTNFVAPPEEELVIYELLVRDFVERQDYQTVLDTLDYLQRLGVNAIEFMPVNEFEGNISWGYNPSFHMALDKYYGSPASFKALIDECHRRGIAVIVDIVLNHAFSQSPLCQLYWDDQNFRPAPNNPFLNVTPRHDFNVGYDFNHESGLTQAWAERVIKYWLDEYRIDGYRFDLSKGLTQTFTLGDIGAFNRKDDSRITILKRMADWAWDANPNAYVIMEHFAENAEEVELANYGMLLWNNINHEFNEATMGYNSNLSGSSYQQRGWSVPRLVTYMESHDEERLVYKNLSFGNSGGTADVKTLPTAVERIEPAAVMFFAVPGPKMIWQFGELGYPFPINRCPDGSIDNSCRTDAKPIRWDYLQEGARRRLYDVFSALINLKTTYPSFNTTNYQISLGGRQKRVRLVHSDMDVVALANFDVVSGSISAQFTKTGWWYEYFSGDSLNVSDVNMMIALAEGGYALYTDKRLARPMISTSVEQQLDRLAWEARYDAATHAIQLKLPANLSTELRVRLIDVQGRSLAEVYRGHTSSIENHWAVPAYVSAGMYLIQLETQSGVWTQKVQIGR